MNQNKIDVYINDSLFTGWSRISIVKSVDKISGTFSLITDKFILPNNKIMKTESKVEVYINNNKIINGYINNIKGSLDSNNSRVTIKGDDKTVDLIDCSTINEPLEFINQSVYRIIKELLKAYPIDVNVDSHNNVSNDFLRRVSNPIYPKISFNSGDSVFDCISKVCKMKAVYPISDGNSDILLTDFQSNVVNDSLIIGENISSIEFENDITDRFSYYIVKGQNSGYGKKWDENNIQLVGLSEDKNIRRYRPIIINSGDDIDQENADNIAKFENVSHKAGSYNLSAKTSKFNMSNNKLWYIGHITKLKVPRFNIDRNLLITDIKYSQSQDGSELKMSLKDPEIYKIRPDKVGSIHYD